MNKPSLAERLNTIESRLDRIEIVLVALAHCVHGWGLNGRTFLKPGQPTTPCTGGKSKSPFEAIASLIYPELKPPAPNPTRPHTVGKQG